MIPLHKFVVNPKVTIPVAVAIALAAGWLMGSNILFGAVLIAVFIGGLVLLVSPTAGLAAILATLVLGQLVRIPAFGSEGAILPNDVVIPVFLAGWLLRGFLKKDLRFPLSPLSWSYATLSLVFVLTFILGSLRVPYLTNSEILKSSFYLVRWFEYTLLLFAVADCIRQERDGRQVIFMLVTAATAIALLGFVQLRLFPDFRFMVPQGWDPHIGRLLSTWFDPNFLAGFLSFVLCLVAGIASFRLPVKSWLYWAVVTVLFAAIVLTFSRSGYAAFLAGVATLTLLRSRRMFLVLCLVVVGVVVFVPRVQERIQGAFDLDATAKLRLVSWENALTVARDFPLTGVGYNTYRYVQVNYGFQDDATEHSAGGSDSSLLTILVTAGPAGLAAQLWVIWAALTVCWSAFRRGTSRFVRGLGVGTLAGTVSVVAHSFFINSLLFPHMMLTLSVVLGVLVGLQYHSFGSKRS